MESKQSVIPLTIIGPKREIRRGGILFTSSNNSKTFHRILSLLFNYLSSKDKIHTICSDEDLRLASAYQETLIIENKTEVTSEWRKENY